MQKDVFKTLWQSIHIIAFTLLFLFNKPIHAFGFGIGLNAPLDIHITTGEDIEMWGIAPHYSTSAEHETLEKNDRQDKEPDED